MDQEQSETEDGQLQMALCTLNSKFGSKDRCLLRFILFDDVKTVENSALGYFTKLHNFVKITIKDVSMIYEILYLMGKMVWWTQFRETLVADGVNVPDHKYDVKRKSTYFSDFRLMMIEIGHQFTGNLDSLTTIYSVPPDDAPGIWMMLLYLENKVKVNREEKASLLKFALRLTVADSPLGGKTIRQYVETKFSSQSSQAEQAHSKLESNEQIDVKKRRMSLEIDNLIIEVEKRQSRVETMKEKVMLTTKECCRTIKQTGEQLKNKIDACVSTQIDGLQKIETNKLKKLDQMAKCLEVYSQQIEGMKEVVTKQMTTTESLNLEEIEENLDEVYPESEGHFMSNIKNISKDMGRFKDIVSKYYVDYKPVDADKCSINFHELNNKRFDIKETITLKVVVKDSQDIDVCEEHQSVPVKVSVQLQDQDKSNNYKVSEIQSKNIHTFEFKFTNTGLWKLSVSVCGEMVSEPINFMIISDEGLMETISLKNKKLDSPIFDVCFTSDGKCLLACNNTDKIFSFESHGRSHDHEVFSYIGDDKKVANLCCIVGGDIFLTEVTEKEIIVLDHKGNVRGQFGKGDFEGGSPQGIAATWQHGAVHVFVSDTKRKRVQHYVNKKYFETIMNLPTPAKRTITPWFLEVNSNLQLFICNFKGTRTSPSGQEHSSQPENICLVEILDVNEKTLVKSLKCDFAVCIDEKCNVFLGMNIGINMYDRDLKLVKQVAFNGDCSYGISAFSGCLAVVCPGSIKFYRY